MSSNQRRMARLLDASGQAYREAEWGIPLVTEQVVDLDDAEAFPEIHLAREHARKLAEARHG